MAKNVKALIECILKVVEEGNEVEFANLLGSNPGLDVNALGEVNIANGDDYEPMEFTPLMCAAHFGRYEVMQLILNQPNVQVNLPNPHGSTALNVACEAAHESCAMLLLGVQGTDVNMADNDGDTPLMMAAKSGLDGVVKLLQQRSDFSTFNVCNKNGWSPLMYAAYGNYVKGMECILAHPFVDVNKIDKDGWTALHWASAKNSVDAIEKLLRHETVNVNCENKDGKTAFHLACQEGHEGSALRLLESPHVDVTKRSSAGVHPFQEACASGLASVVVKMMALDESIDVNMNHGPSLKTGLYQACEGGHDDVACVLLACPAIDINAPDVLGKTPFFIACEKGRESIVQLLLDHPSVDANRTDAGNLPNAANRESPLMAASKNGHGSVVSLLLQWQPLTSTNETLGINVNATDEKGNTALLVAAEAGHENVVEILLRSNSCNDLNATNEDGYGALDLAFSNNHTGVVRQLIEQPQVHIFKSGKDGRTILTRAAKTGRHEIVKMILNRQGKVYFDPEMEEAVNFAIKGGHLEAFQALIQSIDTGDICLDDFRGMIDLAMEKLRYNIVLELLMLQEKLTDDEKTMYNESLLKEPRHASGALYLQCTAKYLSHESALLLLRLDYPFKLENGCVTAQKHEYSWTAFLDSSCEVPLNVRRSCIQAILDEHESMEWLHALAFAIDQQERRAIDTTDAATRKYLRERLYFCGRYELFEGPPVHVSPTAVVVLAYDHDICNQVFLDHANNGGDLDKAGFIKCSQVLGRLLERNATHKKRERDSELWAKDFDLWDKDKNSRISESEFENYCSKYFGSKLKVALKFMRNEDEYKREIKTRNKISGSSYVVSQLPAANQNVFKEHVTRLMINDEMPMAEYPNVLVMPAADRSLEDIYAKELPKETKIKDYLFEVAEAIAELHGAGVVHGDVKTTNIVRVANRLKLIDLDAAVRANKECLGVKFSSGVLPPEMFYKLQNDFEVATHKAYWDDEAHDAKRWNKLKPKEGYVVCAHRPGHSAALPYTLVEATPAVDMWAFGCLMYRMLCGEELVHTDINHDVVSHQMKLAATWTDEKLTARIDANIPETWAQSVLKNLLVVDPTQRPSAAEAIKAFTDGPDLAPLLAKVEEFKGVSEESIHKVATLARVVKESIHLQERNHFLAMDNMFQLQRVVFDGMIDARDIVTPTSFLLSPIKLDTMVQSDSSSYIQLLKTFVSESTPICKQLTTTYKQVVKAGSLQDIFPIVQESANSILRRLTNESMYLYLIDEVSGEIVMPRGANDVYPIKIQRNDTAFWVAALPFVESGLARLQKRLASAESAVDWLRGHCVDHSSYQMDTTEVQDNSEPPKMGESLTTVPMGTKKVKFADGYTLRALKNWFEKKDPTQSFGGLKRKITKEGRVMWTKLDDEETSMSKADAHDSVRAAATGTTTALLPRFILFVWELHCGEKYLQPIRCETVQFEAFDTFIPGLDGRHSLLSLLTLPLGCDDETIDIIFSGPPLHAGAFIRPCTLRVSWVYCHHDYDWAWNRELNEKYAAGAAFGGSLAFRAAQRAE
ncbi:Aste57867_24987 [Aphanomyces stellatus]|uniref:Aste57867_24987 protein n=1 Tax=Aphanomyces stellatus TaxID=120398 RepID=A0A485LU14_9STRA|nr:hypothetical protein As57867_024909 [Aphanomyces stellatus]VFU01618.1 Aste57867_24987 [Aphanomyces stellatus]